MKQLENIEQKDIIKKVTGKVTRLWEPKTFKGPKGEFTIQGGVIEIDGQEYGLKLFEREAPTDVQGQIVTLTSSRSKHGLHGVSLDHESFSKKDGTKVDRDVIKVTKAANIIIGDDNQESLPANSPEPTRKMEQVQQLIADPMQAIEKIVELHMLCNKLVRLGYTSLNYSEETLRSYVSSVFIEANKKGIAILPKKEEPVELDPKNWGCAIVPSGSNKGKKLAELGKPKIKELYEYYLGKGFNSPFANCVEQAGIDLNLSGDPDDLENQPEIPWDE